MFKDGLISCLKAELETFGEDAIFRNYPIKILRGTSSQTKNMRVAGFYPEESFDAMMMHPKDIVSNLRTIYHEGKHRDFFAVDDSQDKTAPTVNEIMKIEGEDFRIREIEVLEYEHGFKLILEKLI